MFQLLAALFTTVVSKLFFVDGSISW